MIPFARTLSIATLLAAASPAASPGSNDATRDVVITVEATRWRGPEAYMVAYIVDAQGRYAATAYIAAGRSRWLPGLSRWTRLAHAAGGVGGTTGASIGSNETFSATVSLPKDLFNTGHVLRIESAVEDGFYVPEDAAVPLDTLHAGQSVAGTGYVRSLRASF